MIRIVCLDRAVQDGLYYVNDIPKVNANLLRVITKK